MTSLHLRSRLLATGFTSGEVRRLLECGELIRFRRGSYVAGPLPTEPVERHRLSIAAARTQLADGCVISHASAAVLHGLPLWAVSLRQVHVTRVRASGGRRGRVVAVHTAPLGPDEIVLADGVPVTSIGRTAVDLARTLPLEQAVVVLDAALAMKLVQPEELAEAVLRATGWPGVPRARRAVAFADAGAHSVGESRSRVAISRAGLPQPELQWEIHDGAGDSIGKVDFGWKRRHAVGEFDGEIKYGRLLKPGQSPGDVVFAEKIREDRIRDTGLGVARWVWAELDDFGPVADRIRARFR